ncbi:MAG: rRNA maturation RNase YbeY [Pseudomonadota bacterium]
MTKSLTACRVDVIVEDMEWNRIAPDAPALASACVCAIEENGIALEGEAALLLTTNAAMQDLNRRFRGKDAPTNVLSFPGADGFLGDIAIGREICEAEALSDNIAPTDYLMHLIVHGLLHLAGYDHETDPDADTMEQREAEILTRLGAKSPYRLRKLDNEPVA